MIRNTNYDHWKHERTNLRKILSEKQYDMFLTFKHWSRSYQAGLYYWDALKNKIPMQAWIVLKLSVM